MRVCNWLVPLVFAAAASGAMADSRFYLVVPIPAANSGLPGEGGSSPGPTDPQPQEPTTKQYAFNLEVLPGSDGYNKWRLTDAIAGSLYALYANSANPPVPLGSGMTGGGHDFYAYSVGGSIHHGSYYQEVLNRGEGAVPELVENPTAGSIVYQSGGWWGTQPGIPGDGYEAFSLHRPYANFKNGSSELMFKGGAGVQPSNGFYCLKFIEKDGNLSQGQLLSGSCP